MESGVVAGSNTSNSANRIPVCSAAANIAAPPMCAIGKAIGIHVAAGDADHADHSRREPAITDASAWRIPLGAAVVPDE